MKFKSIFLCQKVGNVILQQTFQFVCITQVRLQREARTHNVTALTGIEPVTRESRNLSTYATIFKLIKNNNNLRTDRLQTTSGRRKQPILCSEDCKYLSTNKLSIPYSLLFLTRNLTIQSRRDTVHKNGWLREDKFLYQNKTQSILKILRK